MSRMQSSGIKHLLRSQFARIGQLALGLTLLVGLLTPPPAEAFFLAGILNQPNPIWGFMNNRNTVYGHVYTRGVYRNEAGYPVYVEYDEAGEEVGEIGEASGELGEVAVMAASTYRQTIAQYQQFLADWDGAEPPELISRETYEQRLSGGGPVTVDGDSLSSTATSLNYPMTTRSLLVRPQSLLYSPETRYVLQEYPVDLSHTSDLAEDRVSLLIDAQGRIQRQSPYRIGYRSIFYVDTEAGGTEDRYYSPGLFTRAQRYSDNRDALQLTNPVQGLPIRAPLGYNGGAVTDGDGSYRLVVRGTPCPTFFYSHAVNLDAQVPTRHFNPEINQPYWHFLSRYFYFTCNGMGTYNFAPSPPMPVQLDFRIDVNVLSGELSVPGVSLDDALSYEMALPEGFDNTIQTRYDFDLDGTPDSSVCGTLDGTNQFTATDCTEATVQGVYFSSQGGAPDPATCEQDPTAGGCQPALTRLIDQQAQGGEAEVRVATMDSATLQDTDLYIIREATGQLVQMRQGLKDSERAYDYTPGGGSGVQSASGSLKAGYRFLMRGSEDLSQAGTWMGRINAQFEEWQAKGGMAPELQSRDADLIKPGETLLVYAINRPTGYIGYRRVGVEQMGGGSGYLDTLVGTIELRPPNLKVWAERRYSIEAGNNTGEQAHYLIGNEGAGESDDTVIQVYTDWRNADGTALPDALQDYGYTGRLAYGTGDHQLADASQVGTARFRITPGRHAQVVRLPGNDWGNQHFYLQVFGVPYGEYADFALGAQSRGLSEADLAGVEENAWRPKRFVPVKVPKYNEDASLLQEQAYLTYKNQQMAEGVDPDTLEEPEGLYDWVSRPEYQFSVYDLTVNAINVKETQADGSVETVDLLDDEDPTIASSETYLGILYELNGIGTDRLDSYRADQTLVLNVAGQETEIGVTENGSLELSDLSVFDDLGSTDYLTIGFYLNEDVNNVLWEYAFGRNGLQVFPPFDFAPYNDQRLMIQRENGEDEAENRLLVRTLGGLRLRYGYHPPERATQEEDSVESVTFEINHPGWFCSQAGVDTSEPHCVYASGDTAENSRYTLNEPRGEENWSLWWQPAQVQGGEPVPEWSNDLNIEASYTAIFSEESRLAPVTEAFRIRSRELAAAGDGEDQVEGSDVQLLEMVLWQLGVSAGTSPGISGSRLPENQRHIFTTGNNSVGKMLGRFNYFSHWPIDHPTDHQQFITVSANDIEYDTLADLRKHWEHYAEATNLITWPRFRFNMLDSDLEAAEQVFDGQIRYPNGPTFADVNPTYTAEIHQGLQQYGTFDRSDILRAMAEQESNGYQWGFTDRERDRYRITVGGADEAGSSGFNQIQNKFVYGGYADDGTHQDGRTCQAVTAYSQDGTSQVNHYDPGQNIVAKAVWLVASEGHCGRSFRKAFHLTDYNGTYSSGDVTLVRMETGSASEAIAEGSHDDDAYEKLAKGLGGYNQGAATFGRRAWVSLLTSQITRNDAEYTRIGNIAYSARTDDEKAIYARTTAMVYALRIMHDEDKLGLPYRSFIWQGGTTEEDANGDGDTEDVLDDDPRTEVEGDSINEAEVPWCFAYGEEEWLNPGFEVPLRGGGSRSARFSDYQARARNNIEHRYSCS